MSYLGAGAPIPASVPARAPRGWRWFPIAMIAAMSVTVVVNGLMVWSALQTFPGGAGDDGFALSNDYDRVLRVAEAEAALGWSLTSSETEGRPSVTIRGRDNTPVRATVTAIARRPLGDPRDTKLSFTQTEDGHYVADTVLPQPGQWDLLFAVTSAGQSFHATQRLILR